MRTRAIIRARQHDLFLVWMQHRERILALKEKDNKKSVLPRPVVFTVLIAAFFGTTLFVPALAGAAESVTTDEELLAALSYDPKKSVAEISDKNVEAKPTVEQKATSKPAAVALKSAAKATTAPKTAKASKAAEANEKKLKTVSKTISGQVVTIWRNQLSVQFAQSEEAGAEEMLIPLDKKLKLSGVKALSEIKRGDTVKVDYELLFEDKKEDKKKDKKPEGEPPVLGTKAVALTLLKKAPAAGALYAE